MLHFLLVIPALLIWLWLADPGLAATAIPTAKPSAKPTAKPSAKPTAKPTAKPSLSLTAAPTLSPTTKPTAAPTAIPTALPTPAPSTYSPTPIPSALPTAAPTTLPPTEYPSPRPTPSPTAVPTKFPTPQPSASPTRIPTALPTTAVPTMRPTIPFPTSQPTRLPTQQPTQQPSRSPSSQPVSRPTRQPSGQPSRLPSSQPSVSPTRQPTGQPTRNPGISPSAQPSRQPSRQPSSQPTRRPTSQPSTQPSQQPLSRPTRLPSSQPTKQPVVAPSGQPTRLPTSQPSSRPSSQPTGQPSRQPTAQPSLQPTRCPSSQPFSLPTAQPSQQPQGKPTGQPTKIPYYKPSMQPTSIPTGQPSKQPVSPPTGQPSRVPTSQPTRQPVMNPSAQPTRQPIMCPTAQPTRQPSRQPSSQPNSRPSGQPTRQPMMTPTGQPSRCPTGQPTRQPSRCPTGQPTLQPSRQPTSQPSSMPSQPSVIPSTSPSMPTMQPTSIPSWSPFAPPTSQPSAYPSQPSSQPSCPSSVPSIQPTNFPSNQPSSIPSSKPSRQPSGYPTSQPSRQPSSLPSGQPNVAPTAQPSKQPFALPTSQPSNQPTGCPSGQPSRQPTSQPSKQPFGRPSSIPSQQPTRQPTSQPSRMPSGLPTEMPSSQPSRLPSNQPTSQPSRLPTKQPNSAPTSTPTRQPTRLPTCQPTVQPTRKPSVQPSRQPSSQPTTQPTRTPTGQPTRLPTAHPSRQPSRSPSQQPFSPPSMQPTSYPSNQPSSQPFSFPTIFPTNQPTSNPSNPSSQPSIQPSSQPSCQPSSFPSSQPFSTPTSVPTKDSYDWIVEINRFDDYFDPVPPNANEFSFLDTYCGKVSWGSRGTRCSFRIALEFCLYRVPWQSMTETESFCLIRIPANSYLRLGRNFNFFIIDFVERISKRMSITIDFRNSTVVVDNSFSIDSSQTFQQIHLNLKNVRLLGRNGQIQPTFSIKNVGYLHFSHLIMSKLSLFSYNINDILVSGANVKYSNYARSAINVINAENVTILNSIFSNNFCDNFGGVLSVSQSSFLYLGHNLFSYNSGKFGSAVALHAVEASFFRFNNFSNNYASMAGGIYWISDGMPQQPDIDETNIFTNNFAVFYGNDMATTSFRLVANDLEITVMEYESVIFPDNVTISVYDYYDQLVAHSKAVATMRPNKELSKCEYNEPVLSGSTIAHIKDGIATFSGFGGLCIPGGEMVIDIAALLYENADLFSKLSPYVFDFQLQVKFRSCVQGEILDAAYGFSHSCSVCQDGFSIIGSRGYSPTQCNICPLNDAISCVGDTINLKRGKWRSTNISSAVLSCQSNYACIGGYNYGNSGCNVGHHGPLCGICDSNFILTNTKLCLTCENRIYRFIFGIIFVFAGFIGIIYLYYRYINDLSDVSKSVIKIVIVTYQVIAYGPGLTANVVQYKSFCHLLEYFNFFNFDFLSITSAQCFWKYNYYSSLQNYTLIPAAFVIFPLSIVLCLKKLNISGFMRDHSIEITKFLILLIFYGLPAIVTTIYMVFRCVDIDPFREYSKNGDYFLIADLSITCDDSTYLSYLNYSKFMIVMYPLGFTLIFFYFLLQNKILLTNIKARDSLISIFKNSYLDQCLKESKYDILRSLSSMYCYYKPKFWYFDIVDLCIRLFLTAVVRGLYDSEDSILIISFLTSILFFKLQYSLRPYNSWVENAFAELGKVQIFITYFAVYAIRNDILSETQYSANFGYEVIDILLIFLNLSLLISAGIYIYRSRLSHLENEENLEALKLWNSMNSQSDVKQNFVMEVNPRARSKDLLRVLGIFFIRTFDKHNSKLTVSPPSFPTVKNFVVNIRDSEFSSLDVSRNMCHFFLPYYRFHDLKFFNCVEISESMRSFVEYTASPELLDDVEHQIQIFKNRNLPIKFKNKHARRNRSNDDDVARKIESPPESDVADSDILSLMSGTIEKNYDLTDSDSDDDEEDSLQGMSLLDYLSTNSSKDLDFDAYSAIVSEDSNIDESLIESQTDSIMYVDANFWQHGVDLMDDEGTIPISDSNISFHYNSEVRSEEERSKTQMDTEELKVDAVEDVLSGWKKSKQINNIKQKNDGSSENAESVPREKKSKKSKTKKSSFDVDAIVGLGSALGLDLQNPQTIETDGTTKILNLSQKPKHMKMSDFISKLAPNPTPKKSDKSSEGLFLSKDERIPNLKKIYEKLKLEKEGQLINNGKPQELSKDATTRSEDKVSLKGLIEKSIMNNGGITKTKSILIDITQADEILNSKQNISSLNPSKVPVNKAEAETFEKSRARTHSYNSVKSESSKKGRINSKVAPAPVASTVADSSKTSTIIEEKKPLSASNNSRPPLYQAPDSQRMRAGSATSTSSGIVPSSPSRTAAKPVTPAKSTKVRAPMLPSKPNNTSVAGISHVESKNMKPPLKPVEKPMKKEAYSADTRSRLPSVESIAPSEGLFLKPSNPPEPVKHVDYQSILSTIMSGKK